MTHDFDTLDVVDVSRSYGRRRVLAGISFSCRAGEVVGLLGPNGAGKSTLLAMLSTLLTPSTGAVQYGRRTARGDSGALRQRIGWLGHELQLYPELTARENLRFFARLQGADDGASIARGLANARLEGVADDPVSSYSRGMRQRLALERVLLHAPRLVLLDEPFTGLDQRSAEALASRLTGLAASGTLMVIATHDFELASGVLTRALILREGRIAAISNGPDWRAAYRQAIAAAG